MYRRDIPKALFATAVGSTVVARRAAFRGWSIRNGRLISPEGWEATTGDILTIPLMRAQISAYQAKERQVLAMGHGRAATARHRAGDRCVIPVRAPSRPTDRFATLNVRSL